VRTVPGYPPLLSEPASALGRLHRAGRGTSLPMKLAVSDDCNGRKSADLMLAQTSMREQVSA